MTTDEVASKFATNAARSLPADHVEPLRDAVQNLADAPDCAAVGHALRAARPG